MKKNYPINKLWIILSLFVFCANLSFAQTITYPTAAEPITRGYGQSKVTWQVAFPSACTKFRINLNLGQSESVEQQEINYINGSFTATKADGTPLPTGTTVVESNVSDNDSVFFDITGVTTGQIIKFTAIRKANCGIAQSTKDAIYVYGLDANNNPITSGSCYFFENNETTNNYNLLAPAFTIVPTAALNNVSLNQTYIRSFDLINGGNGCANKAGIWIKYGAGEAQLISLKIGATALTPTFTNGDSTYFEITGANLTTDQLFCNGEKITFTEEVKILKCDALTSYGGSWNDHSGKACSKVIATAPVVMNSAVPSLTASLKTPDYDYCFLGESKTQILTVKNTGGSIAKNISLTFDNLFPGSFVSRQYFDLNKSWTVKNSLGVPIGTVTNFSVLTRGYVNCEYTAANQKPTMVKGDLAGIQIAPGEEITIEVQEIAQDSRKCDCVGAWGWTGFRTQSTYTNECASATYLSNFEGHMPRAYTYYLPGLEGPTDILPGVPFSLKVSMGAFRNMNHPNGSGTTYMIIPLKNTGITLQAGVTTIPYNPGAAYPGSPTLNLPAAMVNDTLRITIPQNTDYQYDASKFVIPLIATCNGPNLPDDRNKYNGTKNLQFSILNKFSSCSAFEKMSCTPYITTIHCPDPCPKGGATPIKFEMVRATLGQPDNDENHVADATGSLNFSKIDLKHSINGDTLKGTWNAVVYPNVLSTTNGYSTTDPNFGKTIKYVYVDFDLGYYYPASPSLLALPKAKIKIYPNRNKNATPIECTVNPTIIGNKAHYEFDQSCRGGDWSNDSLVIEALYKVNDYNGENNNQYLATGFDLFTTNIELYSTYTQKLTPQVAAIEGETYTCDHFNDYTQISRIWISPWIPAGQVINGCDNELNAQMRQYLRNQERPTIFPFEYRNINTFDKMRVKIPLGYVYRPGSAKVYISDNSSASKVSFSDALVSQAGTDLIFDINSLYVKNGGFIIPGDEISELIIYFKLNATCEAKTGVYLSETNTSVIGNGINTPNFSYINTKNFPVQQPAGWQVTTPIPILSGDGEVLSFDNTATYELAVQNLSNAVAAENGYLFIDPKNSFTNIVVKEGATVITPDANGVYKLGSIAAAGNRPITITAKGGKCLEDSMRVNFGYGCNGYPTTPTVAGCIQSKWLKIINEKSQIQLTIEKQPDAIKDLCTQDFVQFKISSALAANVINPRFGVIPPVGLVIDKAEMEYPAGSNNWVLVAPDVNLVSGVTSYQVNKDPALAGSGHPNAPLYGLPGTLTDASPTNRSAQLRVYYTTSCDFVSGSKIAVRQRGTRPCGDFISRELGNNGIVRSNAININGATPIGSIDVQNVLSPNTIECSTVTTINGVLTPVGAPTATSDTLQITLPEGLNYVGNYSGSPTLVAGFPKAGPSGTTIIRWAVPAGIASSTPINYKFDISASPISGCGNFSILSEVSRTLGALVCKGQTCPRPAKSIVGSSESVIKVNRPAITFGDIVQTNMAITIPGKTINLNVTAKNTATTAAVANSLVVEYYCGASATPFATMPFPSAVPGNSSVTAAVSVTIPVGSSCVMGEPIRLVIKPAANSCICAQTEKSIASQVIYDIKGNVFNDANGLLGTPFNTVDGNGSNANNQIFAHLLAADGTTVLETVAVGSDGKYEFIGKSPATYSVAISKSATDPNAGTPTGWIYTGEHNGIGNGSDGTVNGKSVPFVLSNADVTNINFGIEQPPLALDRNLPPQVNPGGSIQVAVPSLLGIDPEDGPKAVGATFTIESLPTKGTLYYNGTPVTVGQVIGNFDPTKLTVDPIDGDVTVSFTYTVTDAAGIKSPIAIVNMPFFTLEISGTVFNDSNGLIGTPANTVDGIPTNVTDKIFAHLLDKTGAVIQSTPVDSDGKYKFVGLMPSDYSVLINNSPTPSTATTLPTGWVNTGENIGATAGSDGTVNGTSAKITLVATNQPNVNFGIEQPPVAQDKTAAAQVNPGGTTKVPVPGLTGTDPEDGPKGVGSTFTVETLPTNGTLYYNNMVVMAGVPIPNFDPSKLTVDPIDGSPTVVFTYTVTDNAGVKSPAATVTMPFTLELSGKVFNDLNGLIGMPANTVDGIPTNVSGQLFAHLLAADGATVLKSTPILADGTYKFTELQQGDYSVVINTSSTASITPSLPANWVNTGENIGLTAGSDGTPNGKQNVVNLITNLPNVNFGIEELPTPIDKVAFPVVNPGGTVQSANVGPLFSGTDPSAGIITSLTITAFPSGATSIVVNGVTYLPTNPIWPANGGAGIVVPTGPTGIPTQTITVDPASTGSTSVFIPYVVTDNAGKESPTKATIEVPFYPVKIAGNVFNDINALNDNTVNGTPIATPSGTQLYANLLNADGKVVATTAVDPANGKYEFSEVTPGEYTVQVTINKGVVGMLAPADALPANWLATGETIGTNPGSDGNVNQRTPVKVTTFNVVEVNFGIQQKITALSADLISFTGSPAEDRINLTWKIANEKDFSHFDLQKSENAKEFATIAKVLGSKAGIYNNTDTNPIEGDNYYRLNMINTDGTASQSKAINVYYEKGIGYLAVENPARNKEFDLSTNLADPTFSLASANGTNINITVANIGVNKYKITAANEAVSGMYFISVESNNKVITKKVLIK